MDKSAGGGARHVLERRSAPVCCFTSSACSFVGLPSVHISLHCMLP